MFPWPMNNEPKGPMFINNLRIAGNYEGVSKEHLILQMQGVVFVEPCMFEMLCAFVGLLRALGLAFL